MLRLFIASIALALAWSWLRAEFSQAIDAKTTPRKDALIVRGAAFVLAAIWFLFAVGGAFGTLLVWGSVIALVGVGAWLVKDGLQRRGGPPAESAPTDDGPPDAGG